MPDECFPTQSFGEGVGNLLISANPLHLDFTICSSLSYKMVSDIDVFTPAVVSSMVYQMHGTLVVLIQYSGVR